MDIPPANLAWFAEHFGVVSKEITSAWNEYTLPACQDEPSPSLIRTNIEQLLEALRLWEGGKSSNDHGPILVHPRGERTDSSNHIPTRHADYVLTLLAEMANIADALGMKKQLEALELLAVSFALWLSRRDCEFFCITLVVNGLSRLAKRANNPAAQERLYCAMDEIIGAISPSLKRKSRVDDPDCYWRILLLDRAVVATRSHRPHLMDAAFAAILEYLPEDAPQFFHQSMRRMERQCYPVEIRRVIERYYRDWPDQRVLH